MKREPVLPTELAADTARPFSVRIYAEQSHEVIVQARSRGEAEALMWERIGENGEDIDDLGEPITWGVNVVVVPMVEPLLVDGSPHAAD